MRKSELRKDRATRPSHSKPAMTTGGGICSASGFAGAPAFDPVPFPTNRAIDALGETLSRCVRRRRIDNSLTRFERQFARIR